MGTRFYTVELPMCEGPELIDALSWTIDNNQLSKEERSAIMTLLSRVESEYNRIAESD